MRSGIVAIAIVALVFTLPACGGGGSTGLKCLQGDPHCGEVDVGFALEWAPYSGPMLAPLPIGASMTLTFQEQLCTGTGSQSGVPPGVHLGCEPPFTPTSLSVYVWPTSTGGPRGIDGQMTAPGTVTLTRTGPGDPRAIGGPNNAHGWCQVTISDPTHSDPFGNHPKLDYYL
ncbi:MAG TPA: hypothetical protein VK669_15180 [Candidatus Limnocylindrales bacterium]|nr:hypothetical protein [Candidatus Limnocylindrales bacterium]